MNTYFPSLHFNSADSYVVSGLTTYYFATQNENPAFTVPGISLSFQVTPDAGETIADVRSALIYYNNISIDGYPSVEFNYNIAGYGQLTAETIAYGYLYTITGEASGSSYITELNSSFPAMVHSLDLSYLS